MKERTPLIIAALFVLLCSISTSAQPQNIGKFDTWTRAFGRRHDERTEVTHLRQTRANRKHGFDQAVFEFDGPIPSYELKYLPTRFYNDSDGKHRVKIAGAAIIEVVFFVMPYDDRQDAFARARGFTPRGKLKMPSLRQIEDKGTIEGFYDVLLGTSSRKAVRVSELSNPARLVIDVRH